MYPERIPEETEHLFSADEAYDYNILQRTLLKRNLLPLKDITDAGVNHGTVLEVGAGPGYLGVEWLKSSRVRSDSELVAIDINRNMVCIAKDNSETISEKDRYSVIQGNAEMMPFCRNTFNGVFSAYSLHEWRNPVNVISETDRVLKGESSAVIIDMRRDIPKDLLRREKNRMRKQSRNNFEASVKAAYTKNEIENIMENAGISDYQTDGETFNLKVSWTKLR
ncbi:class I SAM-dependent methyltransferase [Methanoplanus endosymbiosus]|uniref:Class I SAM-dependent methyltransferase n=1 Tax=Methanoplanus endosymbiosus TaxID=33865 RepID=A0A9E7PKE0_9EURY|nr:class I SAM-dependent methyltransferase [Methanoplanus endosymbiosus]UUX91699.1 class I SAM-dependent methyltransferase [Methanoplanus endosymbiosus]